MQMEGGGGVRYMGDGRRQVYHSFKTGGERDSSDTISKPCHFTDSLGLFALEAGGDKEVWMCKKRAQRRLLLQKQKWFKAS